MHEDEHEEVFLQADDEIAMKVMINEASTLLSVVTTGKAPAEESARRKRVSVQTALPLRCFQDSTWTARGRKEDRYGVTIACIPKESCTKKRHCTIIVAPGPRGFVQNMTTGTVQVDTIHILVADRQPNHLDASTQNSSPSSCRVHTKRGIC